MIGVMEDWQSRLSFSSVCGRSKSQRYQGKAGGRPATMVRKWDLKV
jgi:hypothetical protein